MGAEPPAIKLQAELKTWSGCMPHSTHNVKPRLYASTHNVKTRLYAATHSVVCT